MLTAIKKYHLPLTLIHQFVVGKSPNLGKKISEIRISIKMYCKKLSGKFNPSIHNEKTSIHNKKTSEFGKKNFTYLTLFANVSSDHSCLFGISTG